MNKWLEHISEPSVGLNMKVIDDYTWEEGDLDLADPDLKANAEGARLRVSNPLQHIDLSKTGLHIWRIKDGGLEHWRKENYGTFYDKECFLLINIRSPRQIGGGPEWSLHMWIGRWVTPEAYRMTAYKTAELNSQLNNDAVVHREPQGKESAVFRGYFQFVTYYKGSAENDYWRARLKKDLHPTRLLKLYRPDQELNHYRLNEVPARHNQLNNSFVYIMDRGNMLCQWNGELCKSEDVLKAMQYMQSLKAQRGVDMKTEVVNDNGDADEMNTFYMMLSRSSYLNVDENEEDEHRTLSFPSSKRSSGGVARGKLVRVTYHQGKLMFKKIKDGIIAMKDFTKEFQCIIDLDDVCFLWHSHRVAAREKNTSIAVIHDYMRNVNHSTKPAVIVTEGQSSSMLTRALGK